MLRITGGTVYDPANGLDGVVKDIGIDDDGRIVPSVEGGREIDATGLIVFPGGVDVHTHVAGAAQAYGVKAVNPGGVAAWKWGKDAKTLHGPIEGYSSLTPAQIIAGLARIIDDLGLPHPLHIHCNNLGAPGNVETTLETMRVI